MPIDYSKWKKIEVSDDEDDTHPNIDTPSLFRWRHQARLERMAEKKMAKEELEKDKTTTSSKMKELEDKLSGVTIDEDKKKVEKEIADLKEQEEKFRQKEKELEDQERLEPWNIDTIGHDAFSTSRINKITDKPKPQPKLDEDEDNKRMSEFFDKNEGLLSKFGQLNSLKASEEYLLEHPYLASEYSANWLTIEALNHAIDGDKEEEMKIMAQQCIIIQYLLELAKSLNGVATNTTIIKAFFHKFSKADGQYLKLYHDEVTAFQERLRLRGKTKREEALAKYEADEKEKRIASAPGGIDPQEVFEALPVEMRDCFESQDIGRLQQVAETLDREVFAYHFERCIQSGLWVPGPSDDEETAANEATEESKAATVNDQ